MVMELQKVVFHLGFFLFNLLITGYGNDEKVVQAISPGHYHNNNKQQQQQLQLLYENAVGGRPIIKKLFVFGDSYADTGNNKKSESNSWKVPYGLTFPGKPAGRFSDGRVLTDYLSKYLGIKSPIPYQWRKNGGKRLHYGMNFAYGGTGVFDTLYLEPNMSTQIDYLQKLILNDSVYTKVDLESSLVLVTLSGNDYGAFYAKGGTAQGLQSFITLVVNQLALNLKRIEEMGARKVAVTALQPLGCLPRATAPSWYQQCNTSENRAVNFDNLLMRQAVAKLNNDSKTSSTSAVFTILDLYTSFTTLLTNNGSYPGNMKFEAPLKPCCMGISNEYFCGSVDEKGVKLYTVCNNPKSAFFWDTSHPTQAGWDAIYSSLKPTLQHIF